MTALFNLLNMPENQAIVAWVFAGLAVFALLLRGVVYTGYQSQLVLFRLNAKDAPGRSVLKDTKCPLLNRVVQEYAQTATKIGGRLPAGDVVARHVRKLHVAWFSLEGMGRFTESLAQGLLFMGLLFALVFTAYTQFYAVITASFFVLDKLLAVPFDFHLAKTKLQDEMTAFVDREVGRLYTGDMHTAVTRLTETLSAAMTAQTGAMTASIAKLGQDITGTLQLSMQEIAKSVQTRDEHHEAVAKQLEYMAKNQQLLEESLTRYEESLTQVAQKLGDGLGTMVDFHMQNSFKSVNEQLRQNIAAISGSNQDVLQKLSGLFEALTAQSQQETQAFISLKQQLER